MPRFRYRKLIWLLLGVPIGLVLLGSGSLVVSGLQDDLDHADMALVLGNQVKPDGTPSARLQARLDRTLELYHEGYFAEVMASGGRGNEGFDEAVVMRDYLVRGGIPGDHVLVDSQGMTTYASAQAARGAADRRGWKSILVVSQYFHLPRSRLALQKFGFAHVHTAHARYFEARDLYSTPRELVGYAEYLFRSYPPAPPGKPGF